MTATEKKIAKQDEQRAVGDRKRALENAKRAAEEAAAAVRIAAFQPPQATRKEDETEEAFNARRLASEQQYWTDYNALILQQSTAQKAVAEAEFAIQRAADEKKAEAERLALDNRRGLQRRHFEERLANLQSSLANQEITVGQFNQRLIGLFKSFEIPFNKASLKLGGALAEGLHESMKDVRAAAKALAQEVVDRLSEISIRVRVELQDIGNPPGRAAGGSVTGGHAYTVGERGRETFVPNTSGQIIPNGQLGAIGGGAMNVNVYVSGSVVSERDLVSSVREGLIREGRRIGGNLLGGYA